MKPSDTRILRHIRRNARMNLTTISRKTGIPVSTIFDRLKSHHGNAVTRYTALLDFAKLGYPVRVKLFVKAHPEDRGRLRDYLMAHQRVNNLQRINNGYDLAADCAFTGIKEAEDFMDDLEARFRVLERHAYHIIDDIAREKMLTEEMGG